jgi:5-methylcytosine-specific restriction protein A
MSWETSNRRQRLPVDWQKRRRHVLRRDRGVCHVCGLPGATGVDHVTPGDDHSLGNLAAIHNRPCHAQKSSREGRAAQPKQRREPEPNPGLI